MPELLQKIFLTCLILTLACSQTTCEAGLNITLGATPQTIRKIVFDDSNNLWFGTFAMGLWNNKSGKPARFEAEGSEKIFPMINNMLLNGQSLWLATAGEGIQCLNTQTGRLEKFTQAQGYLKLHGLFLQNNGNLIAGSVGSGTCFLRNQTWAPIKTEQPVHISWVNDFAEWNNKLWLGTSTGLYATDQSIENWKPAIVSINRPVNCLLSTEDFIYAGTTRGLYRIEKNGECNLESGISGLIHALANFRDSIFAFGENGAWRISNNSVTFLSNFPETIKCVAIDAKNCLFLGTTDGKIFKSENGTDITPVIYFTGNGFEETGR